MKPTLFLALSYFFIFCSGLANAQYINGDIQSKCCSDFLNKVEAAIEVEAATNQLTDEVAKQIKEKARDLASAEDNCCGEDVVVKLGSSLCESSEAACDFGYAIFKTTFPAGGRQDGTGGIYIFRKGKIFISIPAKNKKKVAVSIKLENQQLFTIKARGKLKNNSLILVIKSNKLSVSQIKYIAYHF